MPDLIRTAARIAGALTLLLAGHLSAQELPTPGEFYFDTDIATRPIVDVRGTGGTLAKRLQNVVTREPHNAAAAAQLAGMAAKSGQTDLAWALYERADTVAREDGLLLRSIRWNQGWDRYHAGDVERALQEWHGALTLHGGQPGWVPPTFALALWALGRKDEALVWYAAAVRTRPSQWNSEQGLREGTADWAEADQERLLEVFAAWSAARAAGGT